MALIHPIYRIHYTWIDPILSLSTTISCFASPELFLDAWVPKEIITFDEAHSPIYWMVGSLFGVLALHQFILLRYTSDINIWKIYMFPLLLVDIQMLTANYICFKDQARLDPLSWRVTDWFAVIVTSACLISRALFIAGVGLGHEKAKQK